MHTVNTASSLVTDGCSVDFSALTSDWTSKAGKYSASNSALLARARSVRRFLRSQSEDKIALVAHGDILRLILYGEQHHGPWANAEVRTCTFVNNEDEEAWLKQIDTEAKEGQNEPTSSENKL